jgi:asparagine synthase (glutamine-hydrolysing)
MSVQYGRWNFDGQPLGPDHLEELSALLLPYGPDSNELYCKEGINILYRAFHTTKESRRETQPHISPSGAVITWDGRLDNRTELISELPALTVASTDVEIVAAAYEQWRTNCFAKLIGDWALSICNPINRSLILAKDPIGPRHLYYSLNDRQVTWCTILQPLVQFAERTFKLCEEYIAGWLACFPAEHLTPYIGVHGVSPSSYVLVRPQDHTINKYWDFDPWKRLRYRTDSQYEEHFRAVLAKAVRRRLRSDRPVLAELSGGIDSSSIVCMADTVIARGEAETPRLDTISYFDNSNPSDELLFLTKVEQKRSRAGYHIDLGLKHTETTVPDLKRTLVAGLESDQLVVTPNSDCHPSPEVFGCYSEYLRSHEHRVILSGIAGEVPTGGFVPTPTPELQDLIARARPFKLFHQSAAWAKKMRKPPLSLLWDALHGFFTYSLMFPWAPKAHCPSPWFKPTFVRQNKAALSWYPSKLTLFGALPSFQHQVHLLGQVRRFLAFTVVEPDLLCEVRYPYLDRDFLEFACAIPREQMVGVGKRRFLMKRALAGIVPDEVLNRKQKALVTQKEVSTSLPTLAELGHHTISGSLGLIDSRLFAEALHNVTHEKGTADDSLRRTILLEFWLRHLASRGVLTIIPIPGQRPGSLSPGRPELHGPVEYKGSVS